LQYALDPVKAAAANSNALANVEKGMDFEGATTTD
jgi:hypothetical protein